MELTSKRRIHLQRRIDNLTARIRASQQVLARVLINGQPLPPSGRALCQYRLELDIKARKRWRQELTNDQTTGVT